MMHNMQIICKKNRDRKEYDGPEQADDLVGFIPRSGELRRLQLQDKF